MTIKMTNSARLMALAYGASALAFSAPAFAQSEQAAPRDVITVTAQKREQAIEDVPISVTVFDRSEIERAGITELADFARRTPNVSFVNRGTRSETRIAIRGISPISTAGTANLTGIFVDEFNVAPNISTRTADPFLFDTAQIEVLKGPQGTYFGRNVVAGAINITSRQPSFDQSEAELTAEVGSFGLRRISGSGSVPLSDNFAVRALGYYDQYDGFLRNTGTGPSNGTENYGARLAALWQVNDRLTLNGSLIYSNQQQDLPNFVPSGFPSESLSLLANFVPPGTVPVNANGFFPANTRTISTNEGLPSENQTLTAIARASYDFENGMNFTLVGGVIDNEFRSEGEGDFTNLSAFTIRRDEDVRAMSIEGRLSGGGDRSSWLIGAIYGRDEFFTYQNSIQRANNPLLGAYDTAFAFLGGALFGIVPGAPPPGFIPGFAFFIPGVNSSAGFFENVEFEFESRSVALFGEYSFDLTDRLTVAAGARYSRDEIEGERRELQLQPGLAPRQSLPQQSVSFDDFSPRFSATFRLTDNNSLYAIASRGYRTGGFNTTPGDPAFDAENLWNYEIGTKGTLGGGWLRYSISAFHMDWNNTQVRAQDVVTQRQFILNADGSEHRGFEVELDARPNDNIRLGLNYGYVDATFNSFTNARDLDGNAVDATGRPVPLSPRNTFSALAEYQQPLFGDVSGFGRVQFSHVDETREDVSNNARRLNPSYQLWNFRVGLEGNSWSLTGYVDNAVDEEYRFGTSNLETFLSGAQVIVGAPRSYGLVLSVRR